VNYYEYRRLLKRLMRRFSDVRRMNLTPAARSARAVSEAAE
jgi:hypothetical protein